MQTAAGVMLSYPLCAFIVTLGVIRVPASDYSAHKYHNGIYKFPMITIIMIQFPETN